MLLILLIGHSKFKLRYLEDKKIAIRFDKFFLRNIWNLWKILRLRHYFQFILDNFSYFCFSFRQKREFSRQKESARRLLHLDTHDRSKWYFTPFNRDSCANLSKDKGASKESSSVSKFVSRSNGFEFTGCSLLLQFPQIIPCVTRRRKSNDFWFYF